ncbi:hypothetical protein [Rhizobium arsenicireducens]
MKLDIMLPAYAKNFRPADAPVARDISFVNLAYRPKPHGAATGGPNGVLAVQQQLLGPRYRGFHLRYHFEPKSFKMPDVWAQWIKEQGLATMSKNLLAAHHYVQNSLASSLPKNFSTRPGAVYHFVCHDIGSAAAAHMCGFPFTLVYHQQGAFVHERTSFGETLNEAELHIMNTFENIAFEQADRVYFPSDGARKAFVATTTAVDPEKVRFGDVPLYNTVTDFDVSEEKAREFLNENGLGALMAPQIRKDYLVFVSVGDYTSNKGIDRCPAMLSSIAQKTDKKVVWICMGSKHKAGIYERIEAEKSSYPFKAILIPERQPHALTMGLIKFADWLLMLQRHSIFDFSTLETMKLGTGVVLSPIGGNLEFSKRSNIVYLDPDGPNDQSIRDLVEASPEEFGALNQKVFEEFFSTAPFEAAYLRMYDDVIQRTLDPVDVPAFTQDAAEKMEKIFSGKTAVICGPGSSINRLRPEEIAGKVLVALNSALLIDQPFNVHVMQDEPRDSGFWGVYLTKNVARIYGRINRLATQHLGINFDMLDEHGVEYLPYQTSSTVYDERYDNLNWDLGAHPVRDMAGVLFSAIQIATWAGVSDIELVGIDFSAQNFNSSNPNVYNQATFHNLASIARALDKIGMPIKVLHTTSEHITEIIESKGTRGIPVPVAPPSKNSFDERLKNYDPVRRFVVKLGDRFIPNAYAKPLDRALKRLKIL